MGAFEDFVRREIEAVRAELDALPENCWVCGEVSTLGGLSVHRCAPRVPPKELIGLRGIV